MCCNGEGLATSMKREDTCWSPSFESYKTHVFEDMMFPREYDIFFFFFQRKWRTLVSSDKITELHIKLENMSISLIYYGRKGWHLVSKRQLRLSTCWIFHPQSRDTVSRAVHTICPLSAVWGDRQTKPNTGPAVFFSGETGYWGDRLKREIFCFSASVSCTCLLMLRSSC